MSIVSELRHAGSQGCAPFLLQAPWGKHNPLDWRGDHYAQRFERVDVSQVLPVAVVKDPLTWMKSMCRMEYAAKFRHGQARARAPDRFGSKLDETEAASARAEALASAPSSTRRTLPRRAPRHQH